MTKEEHWEELQKKPKPVEAEVDGVPDAWFHFEYLYEEEVD